MNVIWRTLITILRAKLRLRHDGALEPNAIGKVTLTTLPTDIDLLGHMNNGRYASLFDLGRFDLLIRTGLWDALNKHGWYAVVASESVTFRKSLHLWQRFTVESRFVGHDEKALYLMHRAVVDGEVYAEIIVRARMLKRGGKGAVTHEELFAALGHVDDLPPMPEWILAWAEGAKLASTKERLPSVWD